MNLKFSNMACSLGGREILKNISGEILSGKVTAVLGPNGCGKSTLLRALLGLIPLTSGLVQGLSKEHGYLPQKKEIYWPLTCETIVGLGAKGPGREARAMERLDIAHLREKRIDEVSGGERTLVLLARVLRDEPKFIIADEPVAELDPQYQNQVMKILNAEAARGAAVLVTMHDIQLTARFCDQVLLLKEGQIMSQGPAKETLTLEALSQLFKISFQSKNGFYAE